MTQADDFDRGVKNRRAVLGDEWVDRSLANATSFNADFQSLITRYAWNDIWGRPGLDRPTRRLLVLGMTMGLARWEEFELHCRAAVRSTREAGGVTLEQIKETLMQGAIYCGVPAANTAFKITLDILREEGLEPEQHSLAPSVRASSHHTFSTPQLHVQVQGPNDGVPVMLSHALGVDLHMWDALAAQLASANHPVLRYDHRGHGKSAVPPGPYTLGELVDDAARLIREWGRGPVVWIGLSMGGMVGQGLALRYSELLRGLVLANTTSQYPPEAQANWAQRIATVESKGMPGIAETVMERYFHAAFRAEHASTVDEFRKAVLRCDPQGYVACCHAASAVNWLDRLPTIKLPTLIIAGAQDVGAPPAMSQAIADRIAGSKLVVLEGAAHLSVIEQPGVFSRVVGEFVAALK